MVDHRFSTFNLGQYELNFTLPSIAFGRIQSFVQFIVHRTWNTFWGSLCMICNRFLGILGIINQIMTTRESGIDKIHRMKFKRVNRDWWIKTKTIHVRTRAERRKYPLKNVHEFITEPLDFRKQIEISFFSIWLTELPA